MQKYKAKKEVIEQVTSKLESLENTEKTGNSGEIFPISDNNSKLQASKNIFQRGDFDDYKISDEELKIKADKIIADDYKEHKFKQSEIRKINFLANLTRELLKPYVGTIFHNKNVPEIANFEFPFTVNSIIKMISYKATTESVVNGFLIEDHFEAVQNIKEIFENSNYIGTFSNDKNIKKFQKKIDLSSGNKGYAYITIKNTVELILKKYPSSIKDDGVHQGITKSNASNNLIITNEDYLSIKPLIKSLTYSGHKLQGRTKIYGMNISIENKKGSYRSGVDSDGHKWRTYMNYDYGYIRGTEGVDGDHVDCYIGAAENSDKIYVIHQNNPVTHKYDEDKCMLCFNSADEAKKAYMKQYDRPGFYGSMDILTVEQFKNYVFSNLGKKIHKSFDIEITDITENNKNKKIEQLQKSLYAIAENKPFVIKHINADDSKHYGNITLRITDFDRNKIEKAVHKMAFSLDTDIPAKGEPFVYKSQEQLTDRFVKEITQKNKDLYSFIISYFGLPEVRVIAKADLMYKGKVLYNPETGKPLQKSDWDKFVKTLEKFLNRNYNGVGERITLSAETLGRILEKLSKTNTFEALKKKQLNDIEFAGKKYDWISESTKNMKDIFGETVSRDNAAQIQIAIDSSTQRIKKVTDAARNDIQQVIIDGIKNRKSKVKVSQELFDKCSGLNRDMQRIADTEIQNTVNAAYVKENVYESKDEKVYFKRFEMMDEHTCKNCIKIKDTIALYSEFPLDDEKIDDPYASVAIWDGKIDGIPMGVMHPYCRGSWYRYYPSEK